MHQGPLILIVYPFEEKLPQYPFSLSESGVCLEKSSILVKLFKKVLFALLEIRNRQLLFLTSFS